MTPCRNLDYTPGKFGPDITLETCAPHFPEVRFWKRGPTWTSGPGAPGAVQVQFCKPRGRIKGIFDCYEAPGPMSCYEPEPEKEKP